MSGTNWYPEEDYRVGDAFCGMYTYRTEDREHKAPGFSGKVLSGYRLLRESEVLAKTSATCLVFNGALSVIPHWQSGGPQQVLNPLDWTFITPLESTAHEPPAPVEAKGIIGGQVDWTSDIWHNPEKVESPGEGYRFLTKSEAKIPADGKTGVAICLKPFSEGKWTAVERLSEGDAFPKYWTSRVPDLDHNPGKVESPGEGYRFLKKSEVLSQVIPAKTQICTFLGWFDLQSVPNDYSFFMTANTFRVPTHAIPVVYRKLPEQEPPAASPKQAPAVLVLPYHNPEGAKSPGKGFRFLTAAEVALPRDTNRKYELYLPANEAWVSTSSTGLFWPLGTYRTPDLVYDCVETPDRDSVRSRRESEVIEKIPAKPAAWQPPVNNPDKVVPAAGWRLLTVFELENPPLDAQYWSCSKREWRPRRRAGSFVLRSMSFQTQAPLPEWHNPCSVPDPGEGYRFLTKKETKSVQPDIDLWDFIAQRWTSSRNAAQNQPPCIEYTYRTKAQLPRQEPPVTCTVGGCPSGVLYTTDGTVPSEDNPNTHRYASIVPMPVNLTESTTIKVVAGHPGYVATVDSDHNPDRLESPGEGFRFLKVSELDTPLTEGAEVWSTLGHRWRRSGNIGDPRGREYQTPSETITYRVPVAHATLVDPDHNPAKAPSPGEGFRFLRASEIGKKMPKGAEFWRTFARRWFVSAADAPKSGTTYRVPTIPAPLVKDELAEAREALKAAEDKVRGQRGHLDALQRSIKRRNEEIAGLKKTNADLTKRLEQATQENARTTHWQGQALDAAKFIRESAGKFGLTLGQDIFTDGLPGVAKYIANAEEQLRSSAERNVALNRKVELLESKIERLNQQIVQML